MMEDKLTDFELAEHYRQELRKHKRFWFIRSVLLFILGYVLARVT